LPICLESAAKRSMLIVNINFIQSSIGLDLALPSPSSALHHPCVQPSAPTTRSHTQRSFVRSLIRVNHSIHRNAQFTHPGHAPAYPILTYSLLFSLAKTKWQEKRDFSCSETRGGETCSHQSAWDCELVGGLRCHHHCRHTDLSIY
jgi:hypothetical protein